MKHTGKFEQQKTGHEYLMMFEASVQCMQQLVITADASGPVSYTHLTLPTTAEV